MKVGLDTYTVRDLKLNGFQTLDFVRQHELEGVQFGALTSLSPSLDEGALREVRQYADHLGVCFEVSVPSPDPNLARPEVVTLGGGSYRRGLERHIELAARLGCRDLHSALGNLQTRSDPDRPWEQHLADSASFLKELAPALRSNGCRIGLETHQDVTTFELVRLVEDVGSDVLGICLDMGNVMGRLEDPIDAALRAAPYTIQTHTKDCLLFLTEGGMARQSRPIGQGSIDLRQVLSILGAANPQLTLSLEHTAGLVLKSAIYDPTFVARHPDATVGEFAKLMRLAWEGWTRIQSGETMDPDAYFAVPWLDRIGPQVDICVAQLKGLIRELGLAS